PARLRRAVQLAQITQRPLPRTARCPHRLHQRPVGVVFAILGARMGPQKHLGPILSWAVGTLKRVGLHYIEFLEYPDCRQGTYAAAAAENRRFPRFGDELRLAGVTDQGSLSITSPAPWRCGTARSTSQSSSVVPYRRFRLERRAAPLL